MIKGIFFDAAGIFYSRPKPTETYALNLLKQAGFSAVPSVEDVERQQELHAEASRGLVSHEAYWDQFLLMRGVTDSKQRKALSRQIVDYSNSVAPVLGGREVLAGLKHRGFILGVVTDTMYPLEWKMRRLAQVGVAEFMDVVACSTVLGAHKPDPLVYRNALEQAHLAPDEAAFVGHDARELEGARRAGMATVAVNYDPDAKADYYCKTLLDLLNVPIFKKSRA
jgi:HAD superfamily hydrolase (TIGR01509 family)